MKFFFHQKRFSWEEPLTIYDEHGNTLYTAQGEALAHEKRLRLYDREGRDVAAVVKKAGTLGLQCELFAHGRREGGVTRKWSPFSRAGFALNGLNWTVHGDLTQHDYEISESGREVALVRPERLSWGGYFSVHADEENALRALLVALVIDCIAAA